MSDEFREFDFTDDPSPEFSLLESRLFAAGEFSDVQQNGDWSASPEEEIVALAGEPPRPRAGHRSEFLAEVRAIERRREKLRRLPVIVACVLAASVGFFRPDEPATPYVTARSTSQNGELPIAAGVSAELLAQFVLADTRAAVEAAGRDDDNWGLVDACDKLRIRQYLSLRQSMSSREMP